MKKNNLGIFNQNLYSRTFNTKEIQLTTSNNVKNNKLHKLYKLSDSNLEVNSEATPKNNNDLTSLKNIQLIKDELIKIENKNATQKDELSSKIKAIRINIIKAQETIQKNNKRIKYIDMKIKEIPIRKNNETLPIQKILQERRDRITILLKELVAMENMQSKYKKNKELNLSKNTLLLNEDLAKICQQKTIIEKRNLNYELSKLYEQKHMYEEDFRSCSREKQILVSILEELDCAFIQKYQDKDLDLYYENMKNGQNNREDMQYIKNRLMNSFAKSLCYQIIIKIDNYSMLQIKINSDPFIDIMSGQNPKGNIHKLNEIVKRMNPEITNINQILDAYIHNKLIFFEKSIKEFTELSEAYRIISSKIEKYSKYISEKLLVGFEEINSLYFNIINQINVQKEQLKRLNSAEFEMRKEIKILIKDNEEKFPSNIDVNLKQEEKLKDEFLTKRNLIQEQKHILNKEVIRLNYINGNLAHLENESKENYTKLLEENKLLSKIIDQSIFEIEKLESDDKKERILLEKQKQNLEKQLEQIYIKIKEKDQKHLNKIKDKKNLTLLSCDSKDFSSSYYENIYNLSNRINQRKNRVQPEDINSRDNQTLTYLSKIFYEENLKEEKFNKSLKNILNFHKEHNSHNLGK